MEDVHLGRKMDAFFELVKHSLEQQESRSLRELHDLLKRLQTDLADIQVVTRHWLQACDGIMKMERVMRQPPTIERSSPLKKQRAHSVTPPPLDASWLLATAEDLTDQTADETLEDSLREWGEVPTTETDSELPRS